MAVLVGYASAHGSTRGVAERIAERLNERGTQAEARSLDGVDDVEGYDAFVLGSAIHGGDWLPPAVAFLEREQERISSQPVWLFSVATIGDHGSAVAFPAAWLLRKATKVPRSIEGAWEHLDPRGYRAFAGVLERAHYGLFGATVFRLMGGRFGDHRDWREIDGWAEEIAGNLAEQSAC